MGNLFNLILVEPLGFVLRACYNLLGSYGLAIIAFTVIVKLLLIPLGIKQQKSTIKQIKIKPKEDLIRKRYSYDKNLMNQKVLELYQREGHNPASGCLPLLIQLPIIWVLYEIINQPLTYIMRLTSEQINSIIKALNFPDTKGYYEVPLAKEMIINMDKLSGILPEGTVPVSFNFLGLDLAAQPSFSQPSLLWIIPILAGVTAYLSGLMSQMATKYTSAAAQQNSTLKTMNITMPLISVIFTFYVPAGVGLYWSISSLMSMFQTYVLNKLYSPAKAAKEAEEELRRAVELRKKKKAEMAAKKAAEIEARALAEKNERRKKAGLPPLESLNKENKKQNEQGEESSIDKISEPEDKLDE